MSGARREDTRRAIEALRQLRRASALPVDAETGDRHHALPAGHKTPFAERGLSREEPRTPD
jgi:hypothetical protein